MTLEINILSTVVEVPFVIFEFLLKIRFESGLEVVLQYLLVKSKCVLDFGHVLEMNSVGNL